MIIFVIYFSHSALAPPHARSCAAKLPIVCVCVCVCVCVITVSQKVVPHVCIITVSRTLVPRVCVCVCVSIQYRGLFRDMEAYCCSFSLLIRRVKCVYNHPLGRARAHTHTQLSLSLSPGSVGLAEASLPPPNPPPPDCADTHSLLGLLHPIPSLLAAPLFKDVVE